MADEDKRLNPDTHPQHKKSTKGFERGVKCPWCEGKNDHTHLSGQGGREVGAVMDCDHCGNLYHVVNVQHEVVISVKQYHKELENGQE